MVLIRCHCGGALVCCVNRRKTDMYSVLSLQDRTLLSSRTLSVLVHRLRLGPHQTTINVNALETPACAITSSERPSSSARILDLDASNLSTPSRLHSEVEAAYRRLPWTISSKFLPKLTSTPISVPPLPVLADLFPGPDVDITSPDFMETLTHYQEIRQARLLREAEARSKNSCSELDYEPFEDTPLAEKSKTAMVELNDTLKKLPFIPAGTLAMIITLQKHNYVRRINIEDYSGLLVCSYKDCDFQCYCDNFVDKFQLLFGHYKIAHELIPVDIDLICYSCNQQVSPPLELHQCFHQASSDCDSCDLPMMQSNDTSASDSDPDSSGRCFDDLPHSESEALFEDACQLLEDAPFHPDCGPDSLESPQPPEPFFYGSLTSLNDDESALVPYTEPPATTLQYYLSLDPDFRPCGADWKENKFQEFMCLARNKVSSEIYRFRSQHPWSPFQPVTYYDGFSRTVSGPPCIPDQSCVADWTLSIGDILHLQQIRHNFAKFIVVSSDGSLTTLENRLHERNIDREGLQFNNEIDFQIFHPSEGPPSAILDVTEPVNRDLASTSVSHLRYEDIWNAEFRRNTRLEGNVLHVRFPRPNIIRCPLSNCNSVSRGPDWELTVSSFVHHLENCHESMLLNCHRWCSLCRRNFKGFPRDHICFTGVKKWNRQVKGHIPMTCFCCDFSTDSRKQFYDHLQHAHMLSKSDEVDTLVDSPHHTSPDDSTLILTADVEETAVLVYESPQPAPAPSSSAVCSQLNQQRDFKALFVLQEDEITIPLPLNNPLPCPYRDCKLHFTAQVWTSRKRSLLRHIRNIHKFQPSVISFLCTFCKEKTGPYPSTHVCLRDHLDDSPFAVGLALKCPDCRFTTSNKVALDNHLLAHKKKQLGQNLRSLPRSSTQSVQPSTLNESPGSAVLPDLPPDTSSTVEPEPDDVTPEDEVLEPPPPHPDETDPIVAKYYHRLLDLRRADSSNARWSDFEELVTSVCQEINQRYKVKPFGLTPASRTLSEINLDNPSEVQRAYRRNRRSTMRTLNGQRRGHFPFSTDQVKDFFSTIWAPRPFDKSIFDEVKKTKELPLAPVSHAEIKKILASSENTAPGRDRVTYSHLKEVDGDGLLTAAIVNICLKYRRVPSAWKQTVTVLIPKVSNPSDLSEMRPISLLCTLYKVLAKVLVKRLSSWAAQVCALTPSQKGFVSFDGVFEHNFLLERFIRNTKESSVSSGDLCAAWLDIASAFSAIPHEAVLMNLRCLGVGDPFCELIHDIYSDNLTTILCGNSNDVAVPVLAGVRQGCPLSGLLFALTIDPALRLLHSGAEHPSSSVLAFADDVVLLANSPPQLQQKITLAARVLKKLSLTINPRKVQTLHLTGRTPVGTRNTPFYLDDMLLHSISEGELFQNLGKPFSIPPLKDPSSTQEYKDSLLTISRSKLAPWQRLEAIRDFWFPSFAFALRHCYLKKIELKEVDRLLNSEVKKLLNLHEQRGPPNYIHGIRRHGCLGLPILSNDADLSALDSCFKLLTSADLFVRSSCFQDLKKIVQHRFRVDPSLEDIANFLNGADSSTEVLTTNRHANVWTLARQASLRLKIKWSFTDDQLPLISVDGQTLSFKERNKILKILRAKYKIKCSEALQQTSLFGPSMSCVAADQASSHFLYSGEFLTFSDWRFLHRARLGQLLLNGCRPWDTTDLSKACRFCSSGQIETIAHVLHHCLPHMATYTYRHNAVLQRIINAVRSSPWTIYSVDSPLPPDNLRPDLVVTKGNTAIILDVTVVNERTLDSFAAARDLKKNHYSATAERLRSRFSNVLIDAIVVGGRGAWDPKNDKVLLKCCSRKYLGLMKKLCISDCISWSRRTYNEHISGERQYSADDVITIPRLSPYSTDPANTSDLTVAPVDTTVGRRRANRRRNRRRGGTRYPYDTTRFPRYSPGPPAAAPDAQMETVVPLQPSVPTSSKKSVTFCEVVEERIFEELSPPSISCSHQCSQGDCQDLRRVVSSSFAGPSTLYDEPTTEISITSSQTLKISMYNPLPPQLRNNPAVLRRLERLSAENL